MGKGSRLVQISALSSALVSVRLASRPAYASRRAKYVATGQQQDYERKSGNVWGGETPLEPVSRMPAVRTIATTDSPATVSR
jgi:hypothetical protein